MIEVVEKRMYFVFSPQTIGVQQSGFDRTVANLELRISDFAFIIFQHFHAGISDSTDDVAGQVINGIKLHQNRFIVAFVNQLHDQCFGVLVDREDRPRGRDG